MLLTEHHYNLFLFFYRKFVLIKIQPSQNSVLSLFRIKEIIPNGIIFKLTYFKQITPVTKSIKRLTVVC